MSSKESNSDQSLAHLDSNLGQAKRDLVLRFVRDQEKLQTSQVDLKLVDDETIDLIDSALVGNEDEGQRKTTEQTAAHQRHAICEEYSLDCGVSQMKLEGEEGRTQGKYCPEPPITPRPPSGRPQSRRRKKSASVEVRNKRKTTSSRISGEADDKLKQPLSPIPVPKNRCSMDYPPQTMNYNSRSDSPEISTNGLNSSWPHEFLARKFFTGSHIRKYAICSPEQAVGYETVDNFSGVENFMQDGVRPTSTQSLRHITTGEMIAARVRKHSATNSSRITCDIGPLVSPTKTRSDSPSKVTSKSSSRSRTIFNFGFEGPLELEPVHASELSMLRSASASGCSSGVPYALVQLPPISREAPAATPPSS